MMQKLICLILTLGMLPFTAAMVFGQEEVPAPELREGDFWHFKVSSKMARGVADWHGVIPDGTYLLRFSERRIQVQNLGDKEQPVDESVARLFFSFIGRSRSGASQTRPQGPDSQNLNFPLFVGKKWEYVWELNIPRGTRHRNVNIQVLGRERIDTLAGNFQVFRIEKQIQWPTANAKWGTTTDNVHAVYFYSSETKSIVKYNSDSTDGAKREFELIRFGS